MPNPKKDCPFCEKTLTDSIWLKHILRQHPTQLLDPLTPHGKKNLAWVKRATYEGQMPVMYFPKGAERFVCLHCETAVNKRYHIEKHFPACKEGHTAACVTLAAKVSTGTIPLTQPAASESQATPISSNTREILAYKKLISYLMADLRDARVQSWWFDKLDEGIMTETDMEDGTTKTSHLYPRGELSKMMDYYLEQQSPDWSVEHDCSEDIEVSLSRYVRELKHIGLTQEQILEDAKATY
jgi:hypothetical protein